MVQVSAVPGRFQPAWVQLKAAPRPPPTSREGCSLCSVPRAKPSAARVGPGRLHPCRHPPQPGHRPRGRPVSPRHPPPWPCDGGQGDGRRRVTREPSPSAPGTRFLLPVKLRAHPWELGDVPARFSAGRRGGRWGLRTPLPLCEASNSEPPGTTRGVRRSQAGRHVAGAQPRLLAGPSAAEARQMFTSS